MAKLLMRNSRVLLTWLALGLAACGGSDVSGPDTPEDANVHPPLKAAASFPVGVALQSGQIQRAAYAQVASRDFSGLTAEYEMKMDHLTSGPGVYTWRAADALVDFAEQHDMQIHGHALVWHQSTPAWVETFAGTDADFEALIRDYITTVVDRYKDRIASWDVVNEAFLDGTGSLRPSVFQRRMGDDYMSRLFQYARDADPDVLLFYNDYGTIWDASKRDAMLALVDDFQRRGIPLDGVGLQMHITHTFPSLDRITEVMDALEKRGLLIHVSELDVRVNADGSLATLTPARSELQRERVYNVVRAFMELPAANRHAITLWGLRDPDSWLIDFWGNPEWPLLYDEAFAQKPAYEGFLQALDDG